MKKTTLSILIFVFVLIMVTSVSGCTTGDNASTTTGNPDKATATVTVTPGSPEEPSEGQAASAETVQSTSTPERPGTLTDILSDTYDDALSARNQLALGTLRLADTGNAVTPEQAKELQLYWQALKALSADSTTAIEETTALQDQIVDAMTPVQLDAIAAMQLTNADLNAFYEDMGIVLSTAEPEPGVTPQGGKNSGLSMEDREATRTASEALGTPVGTGGGGGGAERRDILLDTLIEELALRASE